MPSLYDIEKEANNNETSPTNTLTLSSLSDPSNHSTTENNSLVDAEAQKKVKSTRLSKQASINSRKVSGTKIRRRKILPPVSCYTE
jgi:hypothetical protein